MSNTNLKGETVRLESLKTWSVSGSSAMANLVESTSYTPESDDELITELRNNILQLENASKKLAFMIREVSYLTKGVN